ncbi:MAG: sulfotransferase family protein [Gammaproteobacteria bacterium]|nr:sulfotransferase family protein [Gammaproteobacteria bacterium]
MKSDHPIFFVHIPKTAGTSFRKGAESFFGGGNICYDYSVNSAETSSLVKDFIYESNDCLGFYQELMASSSNLLSGHVNVHKYIHGVGARNTVTFLRDPVERVVSEYWHFVRNNNYPGPLESFYRKPQFINRQRRILSNISLPLLGVVGITEQYNESLEIINHAYKADIPGLRLNTGSEEKSFSYELTKKQDVEIRKLNKPDIQYYQRARKLFNLRHEFFRKNLPFAHGAITQSSPKSVTGWAWWAQSDAAVDVLVYKNDQLCGQAVASSLRPGQLRYGPPRNGYVGFHVDYQAESGDEIRCEVAETGQVLGQVTVNDAKL